MHRKGYLLTLLILLSLHSGVIAQELGLPPFRYFSPEEYKAASRNWSIVSDSSGILYVANPEGVLRYDGITWQKIELPQKQIAYWVEKDKDGNIYVGANGEFGVLKINDRKKIYYESFVGMLEEQYRDFNVVWEIAQDKDGVVFRSRKYLFRYANQKLTVLRIPENGTRFDVAFSVRDTVYMRIYDVGLGWVDGAGLHILPNSEALADIKVNGIYGYGTNELLIASRYNGLFIYNKNGIRHHKTNADDYLIKNKIYDGHHLEDGNYALATMANGIVIITPEGKEVFRFDSSNGLKNNQTLYVREIDQQLWLGTKNGIFQLAYNAPFKSVESEFGLNGQVTGISRIDDDIYVTCNDGFYRLFRDDGNPTFNRVNKNLIVDCVNIFKYDNKIYIGSLDGLFHYNGENAIEQANFSPREIYPSSRKGIFVSSEFYFGLYILNMGTPEISYEKIPGINRLVQQILSGGNDKFLVRTIDDMYYEVQLTFDNSDDGRKNTPVAKITYQTALPKGTKLIMVGEKIRFVNQDNVYALQNNELVKLDEHVKFQNKPDRIVYTSSLIDDKCLICYEDELNSFYCEKFEKDSVDFLTTTGEYIYTGFKPTAVFEDTRNGNVWIGGATGLRIFKPKTKVGSLPAGKTLIRQLKINNDSIIYLELNKMHYLKHSENDLNISYVSNAPLSSGKVLYQYRLAGGKNEWSDWSGGTHTQFNDLNPGLYNFEVRSASPYVGLTDSAILKFQIKKPWYLTYFAFLGYVIVFLLFIYMIYRIRVHNLINKQKELSEKVLETTAQLARANASLHEKNSALKKLDQFKSRFFANVSHDLRTPIMLLSGRVDMLKTDQDSYLSDKGKEYLDKLEEDSQKLVFLTDEIKELVKMEEGKIELDYKSVHINAFFERIVRLFDSAASVRNINLSFYTEIPESKHIAIDPHYIERLMYNLIANALKFTRPNGNIIISLTEFSGELNISVKDDGVGIPSEDLAEVFNRNFQAKNQHGLSEGLGIGLSLVKEISVLHNGTVSVRNNDTKGTEFAVFLPLGSGLKLDDFQIGSVGKYISKRDFVLKSTEVEEASMIPANLSNDSSGREKLLLVEDNPAVRAYMKELVESEYEVYLAQQGQEALEILKKYKIDIIITDLMMPVMDGFEFLKGVKEKYELQNIPVLVVSARDTKEDRYKIMKLGVNNILTKPFDKNEFLLCIKNLLNKKNESVTLKMIADHVGEQNETQLTRLNELIFENISDFNFKIGFLAEKFHLSERSFFRMIKNITGKSPLEYVKDVKFQYAFDLLKKKKVRSLKEVSFAIGMKNTSDFNKQFQKRFGVKADMILRDQ